MAVIGTGGMGAAHINGLVKRKADDNIDASRSAMSTTATEELMNIIGTATAVARCV